MAYLPAPFRRLQGSDGTSLAVLTTISAVATFLILSQFHSAEVSKAVQAAPPVVSHARVAVPTPATAPAPAIGARTVPPPAEEKTAGPKTEPTGPSAAASESAPEQPVPTLHSKHSVALIAQDRASLEQMLADPHTIPQLIHDGRLFSAKPGTKIEILERQRSLVHVRLLEGATADETGWVSKAAVAK